MTGWGRWGASSDNAEVDSAFKFEICFQAQCVQLYVVEVRSQQWLYGRFRPRVYEWFNSNASN